MNLKEELYKNQDLIYQKFQSSLLTTIDRKTIIGVRNPILKKITRELVKKNEFISFVNQLPHTFYEENMIHAMIFNYLKDYDETISLLGKFLPFVDNWAVCDSIKPVVFKNNKDKLLLKIKEWIGSSEPYTVRFGIEMAMVHFLGQDDNEELRKSITMIQSEAYYVNMMISWYFATSLAKNWSNTVLVLETRKLSKWVHLKTIQKAIESYRITNEQKEYLRSLRY